MIVQIQKEPIQYEHIAKLSNLHNITGNIGAIANFIGVVRSDRYDEHTTVKAIEYECYEEVAIAEIKKILNESLNIFDIQNIICIHRIGLILINEIVVWIEVCASHRQGALKACEYVIENLKKRVPIWKKEIYNNDKYQWI